MYLAGLPQQRHYLVMMYSQPLHHCPSASLVLHWWQVGQHRRKACAHLDEGRDHASQGSKGVGGAALDPGQQALAVSCDGLLPGRSLPAQLIVQVIADHPLRVEVGRALHMPALSP